jgi:hypothetical protein
MVLALNGDAAELRTAIFPHGFVMIAWDVDELGALADLAEQLLEDIVMGLRPIDPALDAPEVDDIADQVKPWRVMATQEV